MRAGQYCIQAHRGLWIIRQCKKVELWPNGIVHNVIEDVQGEDRYFDRMEALKRSYQLNGWKWPPRPRTR